MLRCAYHAELTIWLPIRFFSSISSISWSTFSLLNSLSIVFSWSETLRSMKSRLRVIIYSWFTIFYS